MRPLIIAAPAAVAVVLAASPSQSQKQAIRLTPHRVVYDLTLDKGGGSRSVEAARGRIVFDFLGDDCEGYALKYRQVTVLESGETGAKTSDLRTTTFEAGDGKSLRFKNESQMEGGVAKLVDGEAELRRGALSVRLKEPKRETFSVPGEPLFPSAHMKRLIAAARAGETTVTVKVFDGSDDGRKIYDTLAVIGRRIAPGVADKLEVAARQDGLAKHARWPVTLSYFAPGEGERTPVYVIGFELYENGVSRALHLDYGEFALKGDMQRLELLPESACQR
jgi:EipB-like